MRYILLLAYLASSIALACKPCPPRTTVEMYSQYENVLLVRITLASLKDNQKATWSPSAKRQLPLDGKLVAKFETMYSFKGEAPPESLYVSTSMCSKAQITVGGVYLIYTNAGHLSYCGEVTAIYSMREQAELLKKILNISENP